MSGLFQPTPMPHTGHSDSHSTGGSMSGDSLPPEAASLVYDFIALRKNQGMKLARVTQDRAGNLFASRAVQAALDEGNVDNPAVAAVQVVTDAVLQLPSLSDRIVADAVLGLGL